MSYQGYCNCQSIRITLAQQPPNTVVCHCDCCKRSGGSGKWSCYLEQITYLWLISNLAFSLNYLVDADAMTVEDPNATLKVYDDKKSASGNIVKRHFCSNCGSAVFTKTPKLPGKAFLKASLFETVSPPTAEVFDQKQFPWVTIQKPAEK
ncbi:hypothetical protein N7457_006377 [Penicillium paradoxum]|uniref:uncharacterized protein n=1 Tax=Penicillium paradoxum TaxID=176176 RepID=UPI00254807D6|nr:uncharacterized protein N7457_006377 [Penicillium paradoxum]KAJ5781217.1 hypothetical protein N7457_006377 [Penicillium paradoxum]